MREIEVSMLVRQGGRTAEFVTAVQNIYRHRFSLQDTAALSAVWRVLVQSHFRRWINPDDAVLDVGAGQCHFINHVTARRRVAFDSNSDVARHAAPGVDVIVASDLAVLDRSSPFDVVFMSNFLEHLPNGEAVVEWLAAAHALLRTGGRLIVLQPNFRLVGARYFDFIDHKTVLTDASLVEAAELAGFKLLYLKRRFLPYTSKSRLPRHPWLVRLYLKLPPVQFLFGKQTLMVAEPAPCLPEPRAVSIKAT